MVDMLLVVLVFSSVVSVGLLFLPALIEFKKPRDSGPRLIPDFMFSTPLTAAPKLEEEEDEPQRDPQATSKSTQDFDSVLDIET